MLQLIKNFLYPHFSEKHLFTLIVSFIVPVFFNPKLFSQFIQYLQNQPFDKMLLLIAIFLMFFGIITFNVVTHHIMTASEKRILSQVFYFLLGLFTLFQIGGVILNTNYRHTLFDRINQIFMLLILIRSILAISLLRITKIHKDFLLDRVLDDQIKPVQSVAIMVTAFFFSWFFTIRYNYPTIVLLTYFYTSSVMDYFTFSKSPKT